MTETLSLDLLKQLVGSGAVAIRRVSRLLPADGGKVFPPTYEGGQYAEEKRVINGQQVPCVLLDSVQSQANRMELALLQAHVERRIEIPLVRVDFGAAGLPEVGTITSLEAPHRLADAILRDSRLGGTAFRKTEQGKVLDTASITNATGLFGLCPTALVFGLWDSAGERGGLGTKFARTIVAEIHGVNAERGVRPASRLDPLGIPVKAGPLYKTNDGSITLSQAEAKRHGNKPEVWGKKGDPSEANHGNVTPSLKNDKGAPHHGGVTLDYAVQSVVISLPAIRRLRFPEGGAFNDQRDLAARTVLVALALAGSALSISLGCDLRSRCLLVPDVQHPPAWEFILADGALRPFTLSSDEACSLLRGAVGEAEKVKLPWLKQGLDLTPSLALVELVKRARALAISSPEE